jgi:lipoprotein-anchoring transpeptidase ErfK/SrfK
MRRLILLTGIAIAILFVAQLDSSAARADAPAQADSSAPEVLCLPGVYILTPQDCLVAGPAAYLTRMADKGITFPLTPLPARPPAVELTYNLYQYARLKENEATPVYASAEDAFKDQNPVTAIEAGGLRYISYIDEAYLSGGEKPDAFQLRSGGWVAARNIMRRENAITRFQGLELTRTPNRPFGWVRPFNAYNDTRRTPSYAEDNLTGNQLLEYTVVQLYDQQTVDGVDWLMIGPDEWIERRLVSQVLPNTTPPEGVTNGRWIEVNLEEQTVAVYEGNRLVYATMIASGDDPFFTRPGLFPIYKKLEATPMSGAFEADRSDYYQLQDVPWTMYYDKARALHGAYWRTRFGFPQSHGCVNLSPGDAHWLFDWAQEGDWVYVWDPSGQTPTDPEYYGDGGA